MTPPQRAAWPRWRRALSRAWLPVAVGLGMSLAFPPFDWGFLLLVVPAPLVGRWTAAPRARAAALDGFLAGVAFFAVVVAWSWWFGVVAYFPFVVALAAYWAAAGALVAALAGRGVAGPWVVASVWTLFEGVRGRWPLGGFSWGDVGYAFHDVPVARSVAAWGGHVAVTFLVVALAAALWQWRGERGRGPAVTAAAVVALAALAHVFQPGLERGEAFSVAIVQGNDKNRHLTSEELAQRYLPTSHFELAAGIERPLDLVIFPESSMDEDPRLDPFVEDGIVAVARRLDAAVLANSSVEIEDGRRLHNTNFWYEPDGTLQGTYIKRHLVPFGEWVPGRRWLERRISELDQIPRDHAPGDRRVMFRLDGVEVGTVICFESAFTDDVVPYVRDGAGILVVSTNNRSFGRSSNSAQHVAISQMRAAETGRPVVHAAISGKSAFVDERGDLRLETDLFERTVRVAEVHAVSGRTPYVRFGQWVLLLASLVLLGAVLVALRRLAP